MNILTDVPPELLSVDDLHPWLGLASFSEDTRGFFYGREDEVAELSRRVQRKLLTVLFGQSGLGKTSILRAGIVPRLRGQGYCPVYVRIDYGPQAPSAQAQIKQAILRETATSGTWTRSGSAAADESLWEFLHHRDDVLLDLQGKPLIPLLIFDQFEEIFTLAQGDDDGRLRASNFLAGLAELVENRPSKELEAQLEEDDSAIERFDFARNDYRVLITLREDYLPHLESLKAAMPSITQNRLRLAPMTGTQALAAVTGPGGKLVTQEVAEAIVRFVAGGAELVNAQIEPSLLSLICRELNDKRIAANRKEISLDLLAGSHASILTDFYERALVDQPQAVRNMIEDVLLTDSGYRENVAEERVLSSLTNAGALPDAASVLALLVNRRLLRIEDRLDIRRVELTHDVLCSVVKESRSLRHERETLARNERKLEEQEARERNTRKSLVRARQIIVGATVLSVVAVASAVFGYLNMRQAQDIQAQADSARNGAETLVSYLMDDFNTELAPIGRLDLVGELASRTVDYYNNLPAGLRNTNTQANHARALLSLGEVQRQEGKLVEASKTLDHAIALLEPIVANGKAIDEDQLSLSSSVLARGILAYSNGEHAKAKTLYDRSVMLAAPLALKPKASNAATLAHARARILVGYFLMRDSDQDAAQLEFRAVQDATQNGGKLIDNIPLALVHLEAGQWLSESLGVAGRYDNASHEASRVLSGIELILAQQPYNSYAKNIRMAVIFTDANYSGVQGKSANLEKQMLKTIELAKDLLLADPSNNRIKGMIARGFGYRGIALSSLGRPLEAISETAKVWNLYETAPPSPYNAFIYTQFLANITKISVELDDRQLAESTRNRVQKYGLISQQGLSSEEAFPRSIESDFLLLELDSLTSTPSESAAMLAKLQQKAEQSLAQAKTPRAIRETYFAQAKLSQRAAQQAYINTEYSQAEVFSRKALMLAQQTGFDSIELTTLQIDHALALARVNRLSEASTLINQALEVQRGLIANGADSQVLRLELAQSLYVSALTQPKAGDKELLEARELITKLPAAMQNYRTVKLWRSRIDDEIRLNTRAALGASSTMARP